MIDLGRNEDHDKRRKRSAAGCGWPDGERMISGRARLARAPQAGALAPALHTDLVVVAEPHRNLVLGTDPQGPHLTNTSFTSVAELSDRIDWWVEHWNDEPEPFIWHKTADEIIDRVARGRATLDRITKSATHH